MSSVSRLQAVMRALFSCLLLVHVFACAHPVTIETTPPGGNVVVDGEEKGKAPVVLMEEPGCFAHRELRIELPGHIPLETRLEQSEPVWYVVLPSVCLACPTFGLSCAGLQYATRYGQEYEYRLSPMLEDGSSGDDPGDDAERPKEDSQQTIPY